MRVKPRISPPITLHPAGLGAEGCIGAGEKKKKPSKHEKPLKLQNPQSIPNDKSSNNLRRSSSSTRRRVNAVCCRPETDFPAEKSHFLDSNLPAGTLAWARPGFPGAPRIPPAAPRRGVGREGEEASTARSGLGARAVLSPRTGRAEPFGLREMLVSPGGQPPRERLVCPGALPVGCG